MWHGSTIVPYLGITLYYTWVNYTQARRKTLLGVWGRVKISARGGGRAVSVRALYGLRLRVVRVRARVRAGSNPFGVRKCEVGGQRVGSLRLVFTRELRRALYR